VIAKSVSGYPGIARFDVRQEYTLHVGNKLEGEDKESGAQCELQNVYNAVITANIRWALDKASPREPRGHIGPRVAYNGEELLPGLGIHGSLSLPVSYPLEKGTILTESLRRVPIDCTTYVRRKGRPFARSRMAIPESCERPCDP
jgi:hypothetical protein